MSRDTTAVISALHSDLAQELGLVYNMPLTIVVPSGRSGEFEGQGIEDEILATYAIPIYDASGDLIAVKETAPGRKPVRIDIEYEDGGARGYKTFGNSWCAVDNEGNGHCMFGSVRDAYLASAPDPDDTPAFLSYRTPTGKESKHAYVKGLREAAANLADHVEMTNYLDRYHESMEALKDAKALVAATKGTPSHGEMKDNLEDTQEFAQNFAHMKSVASKPAGQRQLDEYRKKLAGRTWGDETTLSRLEHALGKNIVVIGPGGTVQNAARKSQENIKNKTIVLEHVPEGAGHYILVGQLQRPEGDDCAEDDDYFEELPKELWGTGELQTMFDFHELPPVVQEAMDAKEVFPAAMDADVEAMAADFLKASLGAAVSKKHAGGRMVDPRTRKAPMNREMSRRTRKWSSKP